MTSLMPQFNAYNYQANNHYAPSNGANAQLQKLSTNQTQVNQTHMFAAKASTANAKTIQSQQQLQPQQQQYAFNAPTAVNQINNNNNFNYNMAVNSTQSLAAQSANGIAASGVRPVSTTVKSEFETSTRAPHSTIAPPNNQADALMKSASASVKSDPSLAKPLASAAATAARPVKIRADTSMLSILSCPECPPGTSEIIEDIHGGIMVCNCCGLVQGSAVISEQSEWRNFNDDDGCGGDDANRVGGQEGGLLDFGLGTMIGPDKDGFTSTLAKYQNKTALGDANTAKLLDAFRIASKLCASLQLPEAILARCKELYKGVEATKGLASRKQDVVVCACLYLACRLEAQSRTIKEIVSASNCSFKKVSKCISTMKKLNWYKQVMSAQRVFQDKLTDATVGSLAAEACNLLPRFCGNLALDFKIEEACKQVVRQCDALGISQGRQSATIAGCAIYFVTCLHPNAANRRNFTQIQVQTHMAKSTMQQFYPQMWKRRHEIAPLKLATRDQIEAMPPQ